MLGISVMTYSFNIIDWNPSKVKRLDIKLERWWSTSCITQRPISIVFTSQEVAGEKFGSYKAPTIGLFRYLNLSDDWMLQLALKHEKEKGSHSVVKETKEFVREFDGEMENTENAQKLKRIAKEKEKKAIDTAWKSKPLHGQYHFRSLKADAD